MFKFEHRQCNLVWSLNQMTTLVFMILQENALKNENKHNWRKKQTHIQQMTKNNELWGFLRFSTAEVSIIITRRFFYIFNSLSQYNYYLLFIIVTACLIVPGKRTISALYFCVIKNQHIQKFAYAMAVIVRVLLSLQTRNIIDIHIIRSPPFEWAKGS